NALGEAVISRDKARREEAWTRLEGVFAKNEPVTGAIVGRVKGGFTVDLGGASRWTSARCVTSARSWAASNLSPSSRWTGRGAISSYRAGPSSRRPGPS